MAQRTVKKGIRHGYSGYTNHGCGCDICRAAFREYKQDYRQRQRDKRDGGVNDDQQTSEDWEYDTAEPAKGSWVDDADPPSYEDEEVPDEVAAEGQSEEQTPYGRGWEGPVLRGVRRDLADRNVYDSAPGVAALAERLAAIIDAPLAIPQAPACAARLLDIYKEIGITIKPRAGKLATVQAMVRDPDSGQQAS